VHPTGRYVTASHAGGGANGLGSHVVNPATGALAAASSNVATDVGVTSLLVSPNGRNAYVINPSAHRVDGFSIDPATGVLAALAGSSHLDTFSKPANAITLPGNGRFLYFGTDDGWGKGELDDTGAFSATGGASGLSPGRIALAFHPDGAYAYSALTSGFLQVWNVNPVSGALSPSVVSVIPTGTDPRAVTIEPTGRFLYTANSGSDDVSAFAITGGGALTEVLPRVPAGNNPVSISADYSGKFVYVLSRDTNEVLKYTIDPMTGALTASGSAPTGNGANQIVLSSDMQ
jgi:6-phosphogluconolactonase